MFNSFFFFLICLHILVLQVERIIWTRTSCPVCSKEPEKFAAKVCRSGCWCVGQAAFSVLTAIQWCLWGTKLCAGLGQRFPFLSCPNAWLVLEEHWCFHLLCFPRVWVLLSAACLLCCLALGFHTSPVGSLGVWVAGGCVGLYCSLRLWNISSALYCAHWEEVMQWIVYNEKLGNFLWTSTEGNCEGGVDIMLKLHLVVHFEEWLTLNVCLMDVTVVQSVSCCVLWDVPVWGHCLFGFGSFVY